MARRTTRSRTRWRTIADGPIDITDGSAVWTGDEMIVFGAALDGNNHADTPTAIGAAYDPTSDTWRELPPSDLSPQAMTAEWLNGELIAWDYDQASAGIRPDRRRLASPGAGPARVLGMPAGERRDVSHRCSVSSAARRSYSRRTRTRGTGSRCRSRATRSVGAVGYTNRRRRAMWSSVPSHLYGVQLESLERRMFVYNPPADARTRRERRAARTRALLPVDRARRRSPPDAGDLPGWVGSDARVSRSTLDLAALGVQPDVVVHLPTGGTRVRIVFFHDPRRVDRRLRREPASA